MGVFYVINAIHVLRIIIGLRNPSMIRKLVKNVWCAEGTCNGKNIYKVRYKDYVVLTDMFKFKISLYVLRGK